MTGYFHFCAMVNRVAMNIAEQVSVEKDVKSFVNMASSSIAGSYRRLIFSFDGFPH